MFRFLQPKISREELIKIEKEKQEAEQKSASEKGSISEENNIDKKKVRKSK